MLDIKFFLWRGFAMIWNFNYDNRYYAIPFRNRAIQIGEESGTGRNLCFKTFNAAYRQMKKEVLLLNIRDAHLINIVKIASFKYVILDNSDIILTPEIEQLIIDSQLKGEMYWILYPPPSGLTF